MAGQAGIAGGTAASRTYTWLTPAPGTYTIESRATDDSLNTETPGPGVSVTVTPTATVDLFQSTDVPATVTENDNQAVELGVKFVASASGTISGVRFYKGPQNTGTHAVDLWSTTGTKLASATATNETASGWQEADFTTPMSITAGTTYIAAYHTNTGFYSSNTNYFASAHTNGPLTAPSSSTSGGNGVYVYSASDAFPNNTLKASNYWVDPVFQPQLAS